MAIEKAPLKDLHVIAVSTPRRGALPTTKSMIRHFASIQEHRLSLREFNFENVALRSGTWDDALAPLNRHRSEGWKQRQDRDAVDVPIAQLGPVKSSCRG